MISKFNHFWLLFVLPMQLTTSIINAQQTYQLDWGFNINGANASLTIEQGDTVEWTWIDTGQHNVVNTANAVETFDSGLLQGVGTTFSHTFTEIGVNDYECSPHNGNMFGTITVTAPASNDFYLAPNGITCMCPDAAVGDSGDPGNGIVYTKRTASQITTVNAATTCTSGITDMSELFANETSFNEDISSWDTSNVVTFRSIFDRAWIFNQPIGVWDTSSATDFYFMFKDAETFNQPIGDWNTSNVTDFGGMLAEAANFNQPIGNWNTGSATSMYGMFFDANSFNQPIGNWDTSNVEDMSRMFENWLGGGNDFNQPIGNWDVSNVLNFQYMFFNEVSSGQNLFDQDLSSWTFNTNVQSMDAMLLESSMSVENFDLLLNSLVSQSNLTGIYMGGTPDHCNGAALNILLNRGWDITSSVVEPIFFAPGPLLLEADPLSCNVSNYDLGETSIIACDPVNVSNDAPAVFPLGYTMVTWTLTDVNGNTVTDIQDVTVVMTSDEANICYVSADENSPSNNRIFITSDPELNGLNVDFHEVQREAPSGDYETIGFIVPPENSFLDISSDNNTQAYRYKVQTTDVCGQVLTLSDFHKTILLQSSIATNNSVNLAWNPYIGVAFNTYNIYRSVNGGNYELLNSVSSTNTSYNDTSANVVDNFYEYYISIDVASCATDPFQSFELESNREYINPNLSIGNNTLLSKSIILYPNPASELINISASEGVEVRSITLYSALGQRIMSLEGANSIDVSMFPSGVYYMTIETDQGRVNKSVVRR